MGLTRRVTMRTTRTLRAGAAGITALALTLTGCTALTPGTADSGEPGLDLLRAGCPADIRIATDDLPGVEWGFLYRLLDPENTTVRGGREVRAPLLVEGEDTGVTLTIDLGDPDDGVSANRDLAEDDRVLLAAVDSDILLLDARTAPAIGLFAPLTRDTRLVYWDAATYPGRRSIEELSDSLTPAGDRIAPIIGDPADPFYAYLEGALISPDGQLIEGYDGTTAAFLAAGGVAAAQGDELVDLARLEQADPDREIGWQSFDDAGYPRDANVLATRPETLVRYSDCFTRLVPILQRSLVDFAQDPDDTVAILVGLAADLNRDGYDEATARAALAVLLDERILGNGRGDTIGDLDVGRVRQLLKVARRPWREVGLLVPDDLDAEDVMTNRFIDPTIGL